MNCRQCKENLSAYIDGELDADIGEQVVQHCKCCISCGHELEELQRLAKTIAAIPQEKLPADFLARVRAKLASAQPEDETGDRPELIPSRWAVRARLRDLFSPTWNWQKIPAAVAVFVIATLIVLLVIPQSSQHLPDEVAMVAKKTSGSLERVSKKDLKESSVEGKVQQKESGGVTQPPASPTPVEKNLDLKAETFVAKSGPRREILGKGSENAVAVGAPAPAKAKAFQQPMLTQQDKVATAGQQSVIPKGSSNAFESVDQLSETRAKQQVSQILVCATNEAVSAQAAAIKALDRYDGHLIDFTPALKQSDITLLRAEIPISHIQALVQELVKYGEVTSLSVPRAQSALSTQVSQSFAKADESSIASKPASVGADTGFMILEIQLRRPLAMNTQQAPVQPIPQAQPVQKNP